NHVLQPECCPTRNTLFDTCKTIPYSPMQRQPSEVKGSTKCAIAEGQLTEAYDNFPRLSKTHNNIAYTKWTNPT
ncbi:hypothetical protein ACJMK2_002376, partial [Sinanodonta woodiana]